MVDGVGVSGILMEASVLFPADDETGNPSSSLTPSAHSLLRRLRYSKIRTAIFYEPGFPAPKVTLLEEMARERMFDSLISVSSSIEGTVIEVSASWATAGASPMLLVSSQKEDLSQKLKNTGWVTIILRTPVEGSVNGAIANPVLDILQCLILDHYINFGIPSMVTVSYDIDYASGGENSSLFVIDKFEELPFIVCHLNKKANSMENIRVVGYVMKPSREDDFAKRGALPLSPTPNGLMFVPLSYDLSVASQLRQVDGVLHKATDEIVAVEMNASDDKVVYSNGMLELQRCIQRETDCCVIDQFQNIYPVIDRQKIQQILVGLESICTKSDYTIRGPHFLKDVILGTPKDLQEKVDEMKLQIVIFMFLLLLLLLLYFVAFLVYLKFAVQNFFGLLDAALAMVRSIDSFEEPNLESRLVKAKLSLPNIVKPQVACGVADAHSMAIVFKVDDYKGLNVPLPAVIQEYVDHSCRLFKFYVLGEKIFYAVKKSTPNAATLMSLSKENSLKPILFDSLKSLPVAKDNFGNKDGAGNQEIDLELVTHAANYLRKILDLTIFGFDVVIQDVTGDHVIVDLNYLPSFKEIPDDVAVPAFWEAIKGRLESKK